MRDRDTARNPVAKALWFIESHFADTITLAEIAEIAGVSRFHMVRMFGMTTGHSVMRYVRARRLTQAARTLANGAPDILTVALDAGYGSHEAFSRAFRDQFGSTPDKVRAAGTVDDLHLLEPINMDETTKTTLQPPRMEDGRILLISGLSERFAFDNLAAIPVLWQRFHPHIGQIPGQVAGVAYGACYNTDDTGFDYIAGIEVGDFASLPAEFTRLRVAEQRYAVFTHTDHISTIRGRFMTIFNDWFPASGLSPADAPVLERYGERFDSRAGTGGFEIWVPIKA
jgi:AraC family transcriptional regulator